jgi:hypothetical protein
MYLYASVFVFLFLDMSSPNPIREVVLEEVDLRKRTTFTQSPMTFKILCSDKTEGPPTYDLVCAYGFQPVVVETFVLGITAPAAEGILERNWSPMY